MTKLALTVVIATILAACGAPAAPSEEEPGGTASCAISADPACTGALTTLRCDRPIPDPSTTECRAIDGTLPCSTGAGPNARCELAKDGDGTIWCCSTE
jgi:hypothetical protein